MGEWWGLTSARGNPRAVGPGGETSTPQAGRTPAREEAMGNPTGGGEAPGPREGPLSRRFKVSTTELAYMHGLVIGDIDVVKLGKYWKVRTTTSHPAMERVFVETFAKVSVDGLIRKYPKLSDPKSVTTHNVKCHWRLYTYIEKWLGEILIKKSEDVIDDYIDDINTLSAFTAGLMDSDGTIVIGLSKRTGNTRPRIQLKVGFINKNKNLLSKIIEAWRKFSISLHIELNRNTSVNHFGNSPIWFAVTESKKTIAKLASYILKYMRHYERKQRLMLVLEIISNPNYTYEELFRRRATLNEKVRSEVLNYRREACRALQQQHKVLITKDYSIIVMPKKNRSMCRGIH